MSTIAVIPARWGSTRFPGKPLVPIAGVAMVERCRRIADAVPGIDEVIVATDDRRILDHVTAVGGTALMTRNDHPSGSDRLAEVAALRGDAAVIVNLQGDEPLARPADLALLVQAMAEDPALAVATLCHAIDEREAANPNRVKLVRDAAGRALYFSRAAIPYPRGEGASYLQHVGIYAYRRAALMAFPGLPQPMSERAEGLEQLRLLDAGYSIRAIEVEPTGPGVDAPEDVAVVEALLAARGKGARR